MMESIESWAEHSGPEHFQMALEGDVTRPHSVSGVVAGGLTEKCRIKIDSVRPSTSTC